MQCSVTIFICFVQGSLVSDAFAEQSDTLKTVSHEKQKKHTSTSPVSAAKWRGVFPSLFTYNFYGKEKNQYTALGSAPLSSMSLIVGGDKGTEQAKWSGVFPYKN